MKRLLLAAVAVTLPACMTSCGSHYSQEDFFRTLSAAGRGAIHGAYAESNAIVLEKTAKATRNILP